ncbi:MAG: hypothetical protein ACE148_03660 [Vicinamibacterales bacterium]
MFQDTLRRAASIGLLIVVSAVVPAAQAKKTARPPAVPAIRTEPADVACPAILGYGVRTKRQFCDVITGSNAAAGIMIRIPPHQGTATLTFDLHNRHTYSELQVKAGRAFARYVASTGVFLPEKNTLVTRAVIDSEFRTEKDLFDRVGGGAGPGGLKAVAPTGVESISVALPAGTENVSIIGERLITISADGTRTFSTPGLPIALVSNVAVEYRPLPLKKPAKKK